MGEGKLPNIWIMVVFQTEKVTILKEIPFLNSRVQNYIHIMKTMLKMWKKMCNTKKIYQYVNIGFL